ncbi:alpha/beta fold hydrolase [Neptunicoccus sediminis]|uniref:alpha/beta fold hydrolase n=1 Tax=Neptunicoccus sediminis TaxID=1892596 RepID=UPI0012FF5C89|nr:alpha/beta hydrolase [Neptunicoccus sediminis]
MLDCYTRTAGQGPRKALFIHCSLSSGKSLLPLMGHFSDEMTMVAVDLPGQGKSPMPDPARDYQTQCVEACIALVEQSGGPQDLVGHSFGATVALRLAALRPDLVRSLVLFEPVYFGLLRDAGHPVYDSMQSDEGAFNTAIAQGDMMKAAELFLSRWGLPGEWERLPEAARKVMSERMWVIPAQHLAIIDDSDIRMRLHELEEVACPTLVIRGGDSPEVMTAVTKVISDTMPDCELDVLEGAGHMLPITHAAQCAKRLRGFWDL